MRLRRVTPGEAVFGIIAAVVAIVLIAAFAIGVHDDTKNLGKDNGTTALSAEPTAAPDATTPALTQKYVVGAYYEVFGTGQIDCYKDMPVLKHCTFEGHRVQDHDIVQLIGEPTLHGHNDQTKGYWVLPIHVVQGSVYTEGYDFGLDDKQFLLFRISEVGERYKPDFQPGDKAKLAYNFVLRRSPAGDPWFIGKYGGAQLGYGGMKVTIATESTMAPDGHYYSGFTSASMAEYIDLPTDTVFWTPSEFQKE